MAERKYDVFINDIIVAENVEGEIAIILIKGILEEYYNDRNIEITIRPSDEEE